MVGQISLSMPAKRPRLGPRPLALHVAQAEWAWRAGEAGRLADFFQGVKAYRHHPYRRVMPSRPSVLRIGNTQLRDYGPGAGWPLLVVPSLINRAYVLDLMPDASLLSFLSEGGLRPLLLDWGEPDSLDRRLSLDDYVQGRLEAAFGWALDETGCRPLVLGYCMGGTLATALACRRPADCAGLALLAPPWDFKEHGSAVGSIPWSSQALAFHAGLVGSASIDLLQTLFAAIDPLAVPRKFAGFARMEPSSKEALWFVAIEDWLNDGVPLGSDLAAKCLIDWYGSNSTASGTWKVAGERIQPDKLNLPSLLAIPFHDRIVPAGSALALAADLPCAEIIRPRSGHIGMVAGRHAKNELWQPLLTWLQRIAATQKNDG